METKTYKDIFEVASVGLAVVSTDGQIVETNNYLSHILGHSKEEFITSHLKDFCLVVEATDVLSNIKKLADKNISEFNSTINLLKADGSTCLVRIKASPLLNETNSVENILIVINDLTKQINFEKELQNEKTVVDAIMDNLPVPIFFKDLEGKFTRVNKALLVKHGFESPDEIIGKTDYDLFDYSHAEKSFNDELRVIKERTTLYGYIAKEEWKNGKVTWSLTTRLPLIEQGKVIGTFGISRNVTDTVLAEENAKKTLKELRAVNANKDKFFSIISHDLKSPFNGLLGITEILDSDYDELELDEIKEMIQIMRNLTVKVYELLEGLLQWAQTQTGRMEYDFEKIDIYDKCEKVIELLVINANSKKIVLQNEVNKETFALADKQATFTVLRNLVANAIKFTKPEGTINIESEIKDNMVYVSVTDSGIGMSNKSINKLFKIGEHHTTVGTNGETGSGVGLLLCKELIEKQEGKIWVESEEGVGSKFTFTLPIFAE